MYLISHECLDPRQSYRDLVKKIRWPHRKFDRHRVHSEHCATSGIKLPENVPSLVKIHRFSAELLRYNRKNVWGFPILNVTAGAR